MNNLKKKIFVVMTAILSAFLLTLVVIFDVSIYTRERARNREVIVRVSNEYRNFGRNAGNFVVINNRKTDEFLVRTFLISGAVWALLEIVVIYGAKAIAEWIARPVEETFDKQKQFIYDASHELKTPIAVIGASIETLEREPEEKKWIKNIKEENEKMGELVAGLLDLSRTENIRENEKYEKVNLTALVEKETLIYEGLAYEKEMVVNYDVEKDVWLMCSRNRMKELVGILVDNAIKYGNKKSEIKVNLRKLKNEILLTVENEGEEIAMREREKIFERFYRVDKARNRNSKSYGLGLSIARNIVINHGGKIWVECKNGKTKFCVKI